MSSPAPEATLRAMRDPQIRVVAALSERDRDALTQMAAEGFLVEQCSPEAMESIATRVSAEALVVDADLEGALTAVSRVRKSEAVLSTVPIVLVGRPGSSLRTSIDAVEAGGDAFLPRPLSAHDLTYRLRALLELPGHDAVRPDLGPAAQHYTRPPGLPASVVPPPPHDGTGGSGTATGLSPALEAVLRAAAVRTGGHEFDLSLPSLGDDAVDDLIPPELLEPLDAPLDALGEEALSGSQHTPPPYVSGGGQGPRRSPSNRGFAAINPRGNAGGTPTITPLAVGGEMRLSGTLAKRGAGVVLGAASRSRASGLLLLRSRGAEYGLSLTSGHLLAVRSSRAEDDAGSLLARLGAIPREASRFAAVPLDAGVRGAALVVARGYLTAEALAQSLARAAREMVFDLLSLPELEWEMRPLETAAEIPLSPRSVDALLVLGARARIEPDEAIEALGGRAALVTFKGDASALATLPLSRSERDAAVTARATPVGAIAEAFGESSLAALLALAWLGTVRIEGASETSAAGPATGTALSQERTRVRALVEAAGSHDFFALLGVSEWAARAAAIEALEARRGETAGLRARHPEVSALALVAAALEEVAALLEDPASWGRYTSALRVRSS